MALEFAVAYAFFINTFSYVIMYIDKQKARKNEWRISEKTLFLLSFIGGTIGLYAGMKTFRHKTKHLSFTYGLPLIFFAQIIVIGYFVQ